MNKIIKKNIYFDCYKCDGEGFIVEFLNDDIYPFSQYSYLTCPICKGIGKYKDEIYYFIKDGIAFSGDTLK